MSWADALMLVGILFVALTLLVHVRDCLRSRPRKNRLRRGALPAPRPECVAGNWGRNSTSGIH